MIRYNGFFEGTVGGGTYKEIDSYRVDPKTVVDFFWNPARCRLFGSS